MKKRILTVVVDCAFFQISYSKILVKSCLILSVIDHAVLFFPILWMCLLGYIGSARN